MKMVEMLTRIEVLMSTAKKWPALGTASSLFGCRLLFESFAGLHWSF